MHRLGLALLVAVLTVGASTFVSPRPTPCKPTAPIDLEAQIVGDPSSPFGISARARSRTGAEVELEIILPDGVTHLSGAKKVKGRRCEARVDAAVKDHARREILVRASFTEGSATMTRVIPLVLFEGPAPVRGTPKKGARGDALLEFSP